MGNEQFDALEDFLHEPLANLGNALGSVPIENAVEIVQCGLRKADSNLGHADLAQTETTLCLVEIDAATGLEV